MVEAQKREERPELAVVPEAAFKQVRAALDKRLPDAVAQEVVRSGTDKKIAYMNQQAESLSKYPPYVQKTLENGDIAKAFVQNPARIGLALKQIVKATQGMDPKETEKTFSLISGELAPQFARYTEAFVATARDAKKDTYVAFGGLDAENPKSLLLEALSLHSHALEYLGSPLDDFHDQENEKGRLQYLNSLKPFEVVSLLCSDPSLYYTTSNHLLFDGLKLDFGTKGLTELKAEFGLSDELLRNLLLRAINYNRLDDLISTKNGGQDVKLAVDVILGTPESKTGIYSDTFDKKDFYFIANGVETLMKHSPDIVGKVKSRISELEHAENPTFAQQNEASALKYLTFVLTGDSQGDKGIEKVAKMSVYNPGDYKVGGKTNMVEIFDKEDAHMEVDHWKMTNEWLKREYGEPKQGSAGEFVYEGANERITLFMGNTKSANAKFIKDWAKRNPVGLVGARSHSYNLDANMPYDLFGNRPGKYVYVPGSCGSAGDIPNYMAANPATQLAFFSNTSTGRGAVTNTIFDLMLAQRKPIEFKEILTKNESKIVAHGGDIKDIQVFSRGEQLLTYVNSKEIALVAAR